MIFLIVFFSDFWFLTEVFSSFLGSYSSLQNGLSAGKNLVCNWISPGENYCGKRFLSSEELFAHLRTHTNLSVSSSLSSEPSPLQNSYSSYAAYLSRFPALNAATSARYSPLFKSSMPGLSGPNPLVAGGGGAGYPSFWPTAGVPTPGFFSASPYSYYRPPFWILRTGDLIMWIYRSSSFFFKRTVLLFFWKCILLIRLNFFSCRFELKIYGLEMFLFGPGKQCNNGWQSPLYLLFDLWKPLCKNEFCWFFVCWWSCCTKY